MGLFDDRVTLDNFKYEYKNKFIDWRLPENRLEAFTRVYNTRILSGELDHYMVGKVIVDYMKLTDEQKAWYAILFGFSYRNHFATIILQLFPDIWNTKITDIEEWYNDSDKNNSFGSWRRVNFAKDTKWNVRKFPQFIESVQNWLNGDNLYDRLSDLVTTNSKSQNFDNLNDVLTKNFHGIGRMTSWLAIQTLYEFFDWNIDKWDLQLNNDACWSQYDALCYIFDKPDWDFKIRTKEQIHEMNNNVQLLMEYVTEKVPYYVDIYNIESCLCEFRKHWQTDRKPKEFTGWTACELVNQFEELYYLWETHEPKINWEPYILGFMTKGDKLCGNYGYDNEYFKVGTKTGLNLNMHHFYEDEPDAYELLDIMRPEDCPQPLMYLNLANNIKQKPIYSYYKEKYDPLKHLREKK